jgi:hypothetical protein
MPGGEAITLGPFIDGLNNVHHPGNIKDTEVQELTNFEVDLDGSLKSRPPIQEMVAPSAGGAHCPVIGYGIVNSTSYTIAANGAGARSFSVNTGTWTTINNNDSVNARAAVQYENKIWIIGNPTAGLPTSGHWNPLTSTWTFVSSMPLGISAVVYKDRIWIVGGAQSPNGSRLYFSGRDGSGNINWPATNFIDVAPGEYGPLVDIAVVDDNLVLFKEHATYVLGYEAQPEDAILRQLSNNIGVLRERCVAQVNNRTFVLYENDFYELVEYQHVKKNMTVEFKPGSSVSYTHFGYLTVLGDRVLVRYNESLYSFNTLTETWSKFESSNSDLNTIGYLVPVYEISGALDPPAVSYYMGASARSSITKYFKWYPEVISGQSESSHISCYVESKRYDLGLFHVWKRLFWWGIELYGKGSDPSYDHYGELAVASNPSGFTTVRTDFDLPNEGKRFVKLKKAVRFRNISFRVRLQTDGGNYVRVFNIIPIVRAPKQTVVRQVNA